MDPAGEGISDIRGSPVIAIEFASDSRNLMTKYEREDF